MERVNNEGRVIPENHRIQDLEGWLSVNGLRDGLNDGDGDDNVGQYSSQANRAETVARLEEHARYQKAIHASAFREAQQQEERRQQERKAFLDTLDGVRMDLTTANGAVIQDVPAKKLAQSCEMVIALVSSWDKFAPDRHKMHISMQEFPCSSVQEFVDVVVYESKDPEDISGDAIIDCCRISHYLLCEDLLQKTTEILMASIDTTNCLSICQLADELNLPVLFERSLSHMMGTIGDLENNDAVWDDLTPELRDRISAIKTAITTSIHSQSRLYFSSLDEYIAIFAERVQYYKERLAEAKEHQLQAWHGTAAWYDAQKKIEKQERRVRTLEIALAEQKKLFNSKNMRVQWN